MVLAPTRIWLGFLEFIEAEQVPRAACVLWGGFGGTAADVPAVLLGVLYGAHVDDIDISGREEEDDF